MSSASNRRAESVERIRLAFRRNSLANELMNQAVAERLGLNLTDFNTMGILADRGPLTASQIAAATGLTSGAVTGVIDRLERGGFVVRESDPDDRRRVVVRAAVERRPEVEELYRPLVEGGFAKMTDASDEQMEFMAAFLNETAELFEQHAARLRRGRPGESDEMTSLSAPLGGRTAARLQVKGGAALVTIRGGAAAGKLYQAEFEGTAPRLQVEGDTVQVSFAPPRFAGAKRHPGELALAEGVEWELLIRGGGARLRLELERLSLASVELTGGVSDVALSLPRPAGRRVVRVSGGASQLTITRPRGVAARLRLAGGAARVVFDAQRLGAVGGETRLASDDFGAAKAAWDVEVSGGASSLSLTEA